MLLKVEPVVESVEAVQALADPGHLVMLTPTGRKLTQPIVEELARHQRLLLLCGRYEGFDDRVRQLLAPDEISIGDYILGGGEVPAMVLVDAIVRLVPGVLGDEESARCDSFSHGDRLSGGRAFHAAARISRVDRARSAFKRRSCGHRAVAGRAGPGGDCGTSTGSDRQAGRNRINR